MKRQNQIKDSKDRIATSLMTLLKTKGYDEITLIDITNQAEVTRMTLYRHFKSKDHIMSYILLGMKQSIIKKIDEIPNPSLSDLIKLRFEIIKDSHWIYHLKTDKKLFHILNDFKLDNLESFKILLPNLKDEYANVFYTGGIDAITLYWIQNGMKETTDELTSTVMTFISSSSNHTNNDI